MPGRKETLRGYRFPTTGQPPFQQPYQQPYPPYPPKQSTNGFAIASLICGILGGPLLSIVFGIVALNQIKTKVSCDKPHEGEVYALPPVSGDSFPGQSSLRDDYEKRCITALDTYSPEAAADPAYQIFILYPTPETWDQRDRRVACLTITEDKRTGSVKE